MAAGLRRPLALDLRASRSVQAASRAAVKISFLLLLRFDSLFFLYLTLSFSLFVKLATTTTTQQQQRHTTSLGDCLGLRFLLSFVYNARLEVAVRRRDGIAVEDGAQSGGCPAGTTVNQERCLADSCGMPLATLLLFSGHSTERMLLRYLGHGRMARCQHDEMIAVANMAFGQ